MEVPSDWKLLQVSRWLPVAYAAVLALTLVTTLTICALEGSSQSLDTLPLVVPFLFLTGMSAAVVLGVCSLGLVFCCIKTQGFSALASLGLGLSSMTSLYLYALTSSEEQLPSTIVNTQASVFLALYFWMLVAHGVVTSLALHQHHKAQATTKPALRTTGLRYSLLGCLAVAALVFSLSYLRLSHTTQLFQNYCGIMAFFLSGGYLATFYKELAEVKVGWTLAHDEEATSLLQSTFS